MTVEARFCSISVFSLFHSSSLTFHFMPCNHDRTLIGYGICIACYDRAYAHAMCLLLLREAHACTSFSNNDAVIVSILPLAAVKMRCALELCAWFVKTAFQHLGPCCTNGLYLRVMGSSMPCRWSQTDQDSLHIMPSNRRCFLGAQTQQVRLAVLRADTHERKLFREKPMRYSESAWSKTLILSCPSLDGDVLCTYGLKATDVHTLYTYILAH